MSEERHGSRDSVELVYGLARAAYRDQFAQRDQQRTRCGALLAFAGILATLSVTAARDARGSVLIFVGIVALITAAGLFFAGIVWFSLDTTRRCVATLGGAMRKDVQKKSEAASPGDAPQEARPQGNEDGPRKSPLPPPDPELDGTQKRGFAVFKRGPGAV